MANKAVFLDRDNTLISDPGYISDPSLVTLLPGVELAVKSLMQAGYKIIVVTNQSGVARGMITEETLGKIHAEMSRQLSDKGARLDAIYYCPYHPEGTVEQYACDSELMKPRPGMLLKAADELDIDLAASWMVGDSPRDIGAGMRAGCRTVRLLARHGHVETEDEDIPADFVVRNLVDAAKIIMRESQAKGDESAGSAKGKVTAGAQLEILNIVKSLAGARAKADRFSIAKLCGAITILLAIAAIVMTFKHMHDYRVDLATVWALLAVALQVMSLTFFLLRRR